MTEVEKVKADLGDTIFVRVHNCNRPRKLQEKYMKQVQQAMASCFPNNQVLVCGDDIELSIVPKCSTDDVVFVKVLSSKQASEVQEKYMKQVQQAMVSCFPNNRVLVCEDNVELSVNSK